VQPPCQCPSATATAASGIDCHPRYDATVSLKWDFSTLADHLGQVITRAEADLRLEQAVYGLDARDELTLHALLADGLRAYYDVARETRDPKFARRATEIALAARQRTLALDSATLWVELDPTADRAKQVVAGLKGGSDVRGADLKADLERALAEAATAGPRLGEAFLELNRALASEPDKAATLKLVQALAQPYPNNAEAQFAVALAAYNTGLADFESSTIALQAIDRALKQKPDWEQAILLKVEILSKQSMDRAGDYLVEILKSNPDAKYINSALVQVRIQQKRYGDAAAILQRLAEQDPGNHEYEFGMAMLAMQTKDWAKAERLLEQLNRAGYGDDGVVESYLAQVAEETGRYELALERFKAVPDGERGWYAKLRAAAMLTSQCRPEEAIR